MASLRFPTLAACAAAFLFALGACSSGDESSNGDSSSNQTIDGSGDGESGDGDSGNQDSENQDSGDTGSGDQDPGDQDPADQDPGDAGSDDGSSQDPADQDPADQDPADQDPADQDPGASSDDQDPEPDTGGGDDQGGDDEGGPVEPDVAMPEAVGDEAIDRMVAFIREQEVDRSQLNWRTSLAKPPELEFEAGKVYDWILHTNHGDMRFRLRPQGTPMHVSNAIYLTKLGYYDGLGFHRVITGFMAQGGCPLGTGTGSPGYSIDGEFPEGVEHERRGDLSAANSGAGTDGSQFFVCFTPQPGLNNRHTVWGGLVEGFDTLDELMELGAPSEPGTPKEPITIESAEIVVR